MVGAIVLHSKVHGHKVALVIESASLYDPSNITVNYEGISKSSWKIQPRQVYIGAKFLKVETSFSIILTSHELSLCIFLYYKPLKNSGAHSNHFTA